MENLKKERTQLRRLFTKAYNALKEAINVDAIDKDLLAARLKQIEDKGERLFSLDATILNAILEEGTEEEYEKEYEVAETYRDNLQASRALYENCLSQLVSGTSSAGGDVSVFGHTSIRENENKRKYRLPELELKQFDGNAKNWLGFWGQFRKIHEDKDIDDEDKLQYLIQATTLGSNAREVVESFPPNAASYKEAIEQLKSRFARDEFLIEVYVRDLLNLVLSQVTSEKASLPLHSLFDKLETQLRALGTLGVTRDKYAAMLYPLVESSLPDETLRVWERFKGSVEPTSVSQDSQLSNDLNRLMNFLKAEVEGEQRVLLARTSFSGSKPTRAKAKKKMEDDELATAATIYSGEAKTRVEKNDKKVGCLFCDKPTHSSQDCFSVKDLSLDEKKNIIKNKKGCFCCLKRGHHSKTCKAMVRCHLCSKRHFVIMCPGLSVRTDAPIQTEKVVEDLLSNEVKPPLVLLQTLMVNVVSDKKRKTVRALLDSGSQRSYILKECIDQMDLAKVGDEKIIHSLFGGIESNEIIHGRYEIRLESIDHKFGLKIPMLDQKVICNFVPRIETGPILDALKKRGVILTDTGFFAPKIEILLGADVLSEIMTGKIEAFQDGLMACETRLGWTVMGKYHSPELNATMNTICLKNATISDLWSLETLGIKDPIEVKNERVRREEVLEHFERTVKVNSEGRYVVNLPWIENRPRLADNRDIVEKRLKGITRRLISNNLIEAYDHVFKEWLAEGIIETVDDDDKEIVHYLSHHPVIKEASETTKIRPVFNASLKDRNLHSLNDCLETGPNLIELIPDLLLRFRYGKMGVVADIRKAFLQISVAEEDRDCMRFLWWKDKPYSEITVYRHCRVVFGVAPSPFLLSATISHHLELMTGQFGGTAQRLKKSFYVDDCVTSVGNISELETFVKEAKIIMSKAKFDLRGWKHNLIDGSPITVSSEAEQNPKNSTVTSILGLLWDLERDELFCDMRYLDQIKCSPTTKRELLSVAQKLFDPIGFTCPVTLLPKLLLQETWKLKIPWDKPLPEDTAKRFASWLQQLPWVGECRIPRWFFIEPTASKDVSLHTFCDASKAAYGACVFVRVVTGDEVSVQLVHAKNRIASLKPTTIPRMELLAALIGARLCNTVKKSLELKVVTSIMWSDSMVVLSWIKQEEQWNTFVGNRVTEIRSLTRADEWRHVSGSMNIADLVSRGCTGKILFESRWYEGPEWLKQDSSTWPNAVVQCSEEVYLERRKKLAAHVITENVVASENNELFRYFSRYHKILRMVAWILRFSFNLKNNPKRSGELTAEEVESAERRVLRMVQEETWEKETDRPIQNFETFRDEYGLLRIRTKLLWVEDTSDFKFPILLPSNHIIVQRLIEETHRQSCHAGSQILLCILREKYWILRARRTVRMVISKCAACWRHKAKPTQVPFAPLPQERVGNTSAFEVTGIDLAGPLYLKEKSKAWIVLFTCAVYRAVHFELVRSLSTEAFLGALRRFIARRGRIAVIYCDNGTNFVGAKNHLQNLDWDTIQANSTIKRISWKFNPPSAAWWGGWWERLVRVLKELLRRNLGRASLYFEELMTVLCDCEAVINARPLTYMSEDPEDLTPLTPSMFIQPITQIEVADLDTFDSSHLRRRNRYIQKTREGLRTRFRKEYLSELKHFGSRNAEQLRVGDIVFVDDGNKKRINWPLGRILETMPGRDGHPRVAKVKTTSGELVRPFQRLYPLEVSSAEPTKCPKHSESEDKPSHLVVPGEQTSTDGNLTRSGRNVKIPDRLNYS